MLDIDSTVAQMLKAAAGPLHKYWKTAEPIAKEEFTNIALWVQQIGIDRATKSITQEDVIDELEISKEAFACAVDAQIGLAKIAAEDAINAALEAVSSIINGYLGLKVI